MSVLSYFTQTIGKSTLRGLPHRLQSSLTPGCHSSATVQPQQSNFGYFKPTLICKNNWKTSSLYSQSICSLACKTGQEFSFAIPWCDLISHLPFCNASCRETGMGNGKHSAENQYNLLFGFQKLHT